MKILRFSLALVGLALVASPVFAADSTTPTSETPSENHPIRRGLVQHRRVQRAHFAERLGLTPEQREQLKTKRAATREAAKAIRQDTSLTPEQRKAKLRETWQTSQNDMRTLLTPDQQTKLDEMKQHARRAAHRRTSL